MKIVQEKGEDYEPQCLIDIMLDSEIYENNVVKIANDVAIAMFAATDTSKNTTIMGLCHLTKNSVSLDRVRSEVE